MSIIKKNSDDLRKYLNSKKVSKGEPYTHNSIYDKKSGLGYSGCLISSTSIQKK